MMSKTRKKFYFAMGGVLLLLAIFASGIIAGYFYFKNKSTNGKPADAEENIYLAFLSEIYDKIRENYWDKISDEDLSTLFKLGAEKLSQKPQALQPANKNGIKQMVDNIIGTMEEKQKKEFSATLAYIVLQNLKPFGRSGLYTQKQEQELKNMVENVNPETGKAETTIAAKLVRPNILHLALKRFSPSTLDDLKAETEKLDNVKGLDTLILDLRGNVGGSLDVLLYLLGPFIGQNQYAFELFHQGESQPFKTLTGWLPSLVRYKKVIILVDEKTQSSAELMAATLKKYNVGIVVGTKTRGWGTIERVYPLQNQIDTQETYSMFLVNNLTLRDDSQPIEGNGVEPIINIKDKTWKQQLRAYFDSADLINAVEEVWDAYAVNSG
jgi:hypothetical protein